MGADDVDVELTGRRPERIPPRAHPLVAQERVRNPRARHRVVPFAFEGHERLVVADHIDRVRVAA